MQKCAPEENHFATVIRTQMIYQGNINAIRLERMQRETERSILDLLNR